MAKNVGQVGEAVLSTRPIVTTEPFSTHWLSIEASVCRQVQQSAAGKGDAATSQPIPSSSRRSVICKWMATAVTDEKE